MDAVERKEPSADEVLAFLDAGVGAAAVAAALRLGLFWRLDGDLRALPTAAVGAALGIAPGPCRRWLELLAALGYVRSLGDGWVTAERARTAILETMSRETWTMLAVEASERLAAVSDLATALQAGVHGEFATSYVSRMADDPERARRFCRMLLELHRPMADAVAALLDPECDDVLDLGGGSGVLSIAMARRASRPHFTIVDVATVCEAAREIVEEASLEGPPILDRIGFHPGDFLSDPLPRGFDLVVECDVGVYSEGLFRRIAAILRPGGRFAIVDDFGPHTRPAELAWRLVRSLRDAEFEEPTLERTTEMLEGAGFRVERCDRLPSLAGIGGLQSGATTLIEASLVRDSSAMTP